MDAPMLTGRIEAWPVVMFTWACPKCNGVHARVATGEVVECMNPRCKMQYDRDSYDFKHAEKIAKIMAEHTKNLEFMMQRDAEAEEAKVEAV